MTQTPVITGLERLISDPKISSELGSRIGLLTHSGAIDRHLNESIGVLKNLLGDRLVRLFGPQHGIVMDVQDNMIETKDNIHPHFGLPVVSLYSHRRKPLPEDIADLDSIIVDLQDVGTRVYTYFSTLYLLMEACSKEKINVIVLDRPNPIGGLGIEGNVLANDQRSFVGVMPIPMRHGMTMGELALYAQKFEVPDCSLLVVPMQEWNRSMLFADTGLPWVPPSPNLPNDTSCLPYPGTVMIEGTMLSEGRGTTRSLEYIGHPKLDPYQLSISGNKKLEEVGLKGVTLRPTYFQPTFQKHAGKTCGGIQLHVNDPVAFQPWKTVLCLLRSAYELLDGKDFWQIPPYEYETERVPFDVIHGSEDVRRWVCEEGDEHQLSLLDLAGRREYLTRREEILLYE